MAVQELQDLQVSKVIEYTVQKLQNCTPTFDKNSVKSIENSPPGLDPDVQVPIEVDAQASCEEYEFHCANKECVNINHVCDGVSQCLDDSDERYCSTKPEMR